MSSQAGDVADYSKTCGIVEAKLFGFSIDSDELKTRHREWLDDFVVPILSQGGSISLVGEASRSGANAHNQALSMRRAERVLGYLRGRVNGLVRCSIDTAFEGTSVRGVGESAAAVAGMKDGTEAALYRAVRVRAWARLAPPPLPQAQPSPQKTVRRVISRTWHSVNTRTPGGGNPYHDGEAGAMLGELVNKMIDAKEKGGSDSRTYHDYPPDYVVVRVHEEFTVDDSLWTGPVSTTSILHVIRYEWGPRTPTVTLFETRTSITKAKTRKVVKEVRSYPRSEIWKKVTAPDAKVFG